MPPGSLALDRTLSAPASIQGGRDTVAQLVLTGEPVALFCSSDAAAAGAASEAGVRGLAVPGHRAVCGFGDLEIGRSMDPAITTISVDGAEIGRMAACCLLARLSGRTAPRRVAMPFHVVQRGTTAGPGSRSGKTLTRF